MSFRILYLPLNYLKKSVLKIFRHISVVTNFKLQIVKYISRLKNKQTMITAIYQLLAITVYSVLKLCYRLASKDFKDI